MMAESLDIFGKVGSTLGQVLALNSESAYLWAFLIVIGCAAFGSMIVSVIAAWKAQSSQVKVQEQDKRADRQLTMISDVNKSVKDLAHATPPPGQTPTITPIVPTIIPPTIPGVPTIPGMPTFPMMPLGPGMTPESVIASMLMGFLTKSMNVAPGQPNQAGTVTETTENGPQPGETSTSVTVSSSTAPPPSATTTEAQAPAKAGEGEARETTS